MNKPILGTFRKVSKSSSYYFLYFRFSDLNIPTISNIVISGKSHRIHLHQIDEFYYIFITKDLDDTYSWLIDNKSFIELNLVEEWIKWKKKK